MEPGWKVVGDLTIKDVTREVVLDTEYLGTFKSPMGPTVAASTLPQPCGQSAAAEKIAER